MNRKRGSSVGGVRTTNEFCDLWAPTTSLHFGYALLIDLVSATLPLSLRREKEFGARFHSRRSWLLTWRRTNCVLVEIMYPAIILVAITSMGNHLCLNVVGGAITVGLAWQGKRLLLGLLQLEDCFFRLIRTYKPEVES